MFWLSQYDNCKNNINSSRFSVIIHNPHHDFLSYSPVRYPRMRFHRRTSQQRYFDVHGNCDATETISTSSANNHSTMQRRQKITCTWTNGNIRMTCFETCGQKALLISKKCKGKMSLRNQGFAVECVNNFQNKGSYPSSGSCSCSVEKCPRKLICTDELL